MAAVRMTHVCFLPERANAATLRAATRKALGSVGFTAVSRAEGEMSGDLFVRVSEPGPAPSPGRLLHPRAV